VQLLKSKYKIFNCTMIFTMTNPRYHDAELDEPWLDLKKTRRLDVIAAHHSRSLATPRVQEHRRTSKSRRHPKRKRRGAAPPRPPWWSQRSVATNPRSPRRAACLCSAKIPADYLQTTSVFLSSRLLFEVLFVYCCLVLIFVLGGFIDYFSIFCSASSRMIDVLEFLSVGSMRILQRKPEQLRFSYTLAFASVQLSLHSRSSAVPNLNYDLP